MKTGFGDFCFGVLACAACTIVCLSVLHLLTSDCPPAACAPPPAQEVQLNRWEVLKDSIIRKPTSVKVIVFDTATGTVGSFEVSVFDEEIPVVPPDSEEIEELLLDDNDA